MPNYDDNPGLKLPEPTPPTETQDLPHMKTADARGYMNYEEPERLFAAPTERVDDVIARMIQEVAPAPLCVSETAVRQLRPLLEELAQRRGMERVETSRDDLAAAIELLKRTIPFTQCDSDCDCEGDRLYQETLAFIDKVAAVAPSPAGESQEDSNA